LNPFEIGEEQPSTNEGFCLANSKTIAKTIRLLLRVGANPKGYRIAGCFEHIFAHAINFFAGFLVRRFGRNNKPFPQMVRVKL